MRTVLPAGVLGALVAFVGLAAASPARAGEAECALFGVSGLCRAPVDLALDFGASFFGYEMESKAQIDQPGFEDLIGGGMAVAFDDEHPQRTGRDLEHNPIALQVGLRASGGIAFHCDDIVIEPAVAFWRSLPVAAARDSGATDRDRVQELLVPSFLSDLQSRAESEVIYLDGWDVGFGPMIAIPGLVGWTDRPVVFFPFIGVSHAEWNTRLKQHQSLDLDDLAGPDFIDFQARNRDDPGFEEDLFMVGFDLDVPLPGRHGPFQHDLTFGFKWVDGGEEHDMRPTVPFTEEEVFPDGTARYVFEDIEGYRVEIRYRVTWVDFGGFFRRTIFGPAQ